MKYFDDATKTVKTVKKKIPPPPVVSVDILPMHLANPDLLKDLVNQKCLQARGLQAGAEMRKMNEFSKTIPGTDTFDINVQQYLALPKSVKRHMNGVVNTSVVQWKEQSLPKAQYGPIDPYEFGSRLGDGSTYDVSYNVPIEYVVNSEDNRLKLLAGMIDAAGRLTEHEYDHYTEGYYSYGYAISQRKKRKHLLESFRIIAGSLGFRAKISDSTNCCGMFELSITGNNIDKIPVKTPRYQLTLQRTRNNCGVHKIEIKSIGRGPFCGWNIDKNERFLLGDFTITHNTRLQGGKDSASERYIFTILNPLTRMLFRPEDDGIMKYLNDDGELVEPVFYAPTIPLVLVNGTKGIGTGFSTDIMCHNPLQIIAYMRALIADSDETCGITDSAGTSASGIAIEPFYQGFKGTIAKLNLPSESVSGPAKYAIKGSYIAIDDHRIRVTELPIGFWTEDFKTHLEALMEPTTSGTGANAVHTPPHVKEYCDMSTDSTVDFMITMTQPIAERDRCQAATSVTECNGLEKTLKLYTTQSTSNMNLFDENEKLRRYETVYDIARAFFPVRRDIYERRRSAMLAKLLSELEVLSNRAKYIQEQLDDTLDLRRQKRESINALLSSRGYAVRDGGYDYLLKMTQDGVTEEKVTALMSDRDGKEQEYAELMETSASALWIRDLDALESAYSVIVERKRREEDSVSKGGSVGCSTIDGMKVKRTMINKKVGLNSGKNKM